MNMLRVAWWKWLCIILLLYVVVMGFWGEVPRRAILNESIRNLYFHVPMWFAMIGLFSQALWYNIRYLRTNDLQYDRFALAAISVGTTFGVFGIITGSMWARVTWNAWWVPDVKLNGSAVLLLIYFAWFILRGSLPKGGQRAKVSAVYSIFAAAAIVPLILVLPRVYDSLHPGNGGNPGFSSYDLDSRMRAVFYPAVLGWWLMGLWISTLYRRYLTLNDKIEIYTIPDLDAAGR